MSKVYSVHSTFLTLQGEGFHAGRKAVFVRFTGCNVWSGRDEDRERDSERHSRCAAICDTDFFAPQPAQGGGVYTAQGLAARIRFLWGKTTESPFVVLTGGEPSLQVNDRLLEQLADCYVAIETNGTKLLPLDLDWVTLSPKPPMDVVDQHYDEIKVLYPQFDPLPYEKHVVGRKNPLLWVQPVDFTSRFVHLRNKNPVSPMSYDVSTSNRGALKECFSFVTEHPKWRLSFQMHKAAGLL